MENLFNARIARLLGLIALVAIICFAVSACSLTETEVTFRNNSSYSVSVTMESGRGWSPSSFTLASGRTRVVSTRQSVSTVRCTYSPANRVYFSWNSSNNTYTIRDL